MKKTLKQKNERRAQGLANWINWNFNLRQLARQVRRAARHGKSFQAVIDSTKSKLDRGSQNRHFLATVGLRKCEQTMRVAKYYCGAFNIPMTDESFSL